MKFTNGLLGLCALLMASQINAATIFQATDGDINIASTTGGGQFAIFDNEADLNDGTPLLVITLYDRIIVDPTPPAATTSLTIFGTSSTLNITSSNFVFGATTSSGNAPWVLGVGTELSPGSNLWDITFADLGGQGGPELKMVVDIQAVPVPAAVWLFGSGLIGLVGVARRKKA